MYFFNKHKQKLFNHIFNSTAGHTMFQLFQFPLLLFQIEGYVKLPKFERAKFHLCLFERLYSMCVGGRVGDAGGG